MLIRTSNKEIQRTDKSCYLDAPSSISRRDHLYRARRYAYDRSIDPVQVELVRDVVGERVGLTIVEVGSATGTLIREAIDGQNSAIALDMNRFSLQKAGTIPSIQGDAHRLPIRDGIADVVLAMHLVEHLNEPAMFFAEARRICAVGGCVVIAVPAEPFRGAFAIWSSLKLFGHPFGVRRIHLHALNPATLSELAMMVGMRVVWSRLSWVPLPQWLAVLRVEEPLDRPGHRGVLPLSSR
jgi:SAM-dependent methyltransferase